MIYNAEHNISEEDFADVEKSVKEPVVIEDYVFIGPRAIILPGVTLKKGAVVGAGAVVTKDVEEFKIVGGVPAREIGERQNKNPNYKLGRAAWFR
jgi:maltose O-acetyltransferase